jgi:hypothetical protein
MTETEAPIKTREVVKAMMDIFLHWTVRIGLPVGLEKTATVLNGIGSYNDFRPHKVIKILEEFLVKDAELKKLQPDRVWQSYITVGRENSPVVYISIQKEHLSWLREEFRLAGADEIGCVDESKEQVLLRAFWD